MKKPCKICGENECNSCEYLGKLKTTIVFLGCLIFLMIIIYFLL